jgi:hypothetical protein
MNYDQNDSINDLDHVYKRGAYAPQPSPMNNPGAPTSGGISKPTVFPRSQPTGPAAQAETPESRSARLMVEQTNKASQAYKSSGGQIGKMISGGMPMQAAPQPNPMNTGGGIPDDGIVGPETYHTSQKPVRLNRSGQVDEGGYEMSRFRYERAKKSGKGLDAARQEFEGYSQGAEVQLHGGSATGKVIKSKVIPGAGKVPSTVEQAALPGLVEAGVNVPHRLSQGLSADKSIAEQQIQQRKLQQQEPGQFDILPPGVQKGITPSRKSK